MYELFKAIKQRFSMLSSASFPGGIHMGTAPSGTSMAYVVIVPVSAVPEFNTSKVYDQRAQIQFSIFAVGAASVASLGKTLRDHFNFRPLPLDRGRLIEARLTNEIGPLEDDSDEDGDAVFHYILEFDFLQQQSHV